MKCRILLVEDTPEIQLLVRSILSEHICVVASSLKEARTYLTTQTFDLLLLDVVLPDGNGFEFYSSLGAIFSNSRDFPTTIFLTSRSETSEKVMGLTLGADDYITKPFDILEFKARIESKIRKRQSEVQDSQELCAGDLKLDLLSQKLWIQSDVINLTSTEFQLLSYFIQHEGHVLSREQLLQNIWGNKVHVLDRTVDGQIKSLRRKIEKSSTCIKTIYGGGYVFELAQKKRAVGE